MRVRYSRLRKRVGPFAKQLTIAGGLLILPMTIAMESGAAAAPGSQVKASHSCLTSTPDPRTIRLERFFAHLHCPITNLAEDFVRAADRNHLDWRLLPSISVVESGGGKAYRNNNIFGWNNGIQPFPTLRAGLDTVASNLGRSPLYRNRDLVGKLRLYNPDADYVGKVVQVMYRISPRPSLQTAVQHVGGEESDFTSAAN